MSYILILVKLYFFILLHLPSLKPPHYRALLSLVLDSLALPALENAAIEIRLIDEGHGIHHGELTESIFAGCRGVDCIYDPRIESLLYVPWILKP